jgi:hypothetical protein
MTQRYFAGNKLASFFRTVAGTVEAQTASTFDTSYVNNSIAVIGTVEYIQTPPFQDANNANTLWTHFDYNGGTNGNKLLRFSNTTGVTVCQILSLGANQPFSFQYWNNSAFVTLGDQILTISSGVLTTLDIKLLCYNAPGTSSNANVTIYKGGTLIWSANVPGNTITDVATVQFHGSASGGSFTYYSQIIGADFDTRDLKLVEPIINGEGPVTDGVGVYTDINDMPLNDNTSITLANSNNTHLFAKSLVNLPPGYIVDSAWIGARARVNGPTVANANLVFRSSGVDYSSTGRGYNSGYEPRIYYSATNPATNAAWTITEYNNANVGIKTP